MTGKEITVFVLGLFLAGFLYLMKLPPKVNTEQSISIIQPANPVNNQAKQTDDFNPETDKPIAEKPQEIPAWSFDFSTIGALTSEELVKSINKALSEGRYFQPKSNNALFFLSNLKTIDKTNNNIAAVTQQLESILSKQSQQAIANNDDKKLLTLISRLKTLSSNQATIQSLKQQLNQIKTINKLFSKGKKQIDNRQIVNDDSIDAWHTAKQMQELDKKNSKTTKLVNQVNQILINDALRAAEEIDFQLAETHISQAQLLDAESDFVQFIQEKVQKLKRQRQEWLEQQLNSAIAHVNQSRANRLLRQLLDLGIEQSQLDNYQQELERITILGKYKPFESFSDSTTTGDSLPQMVVMPVGSLQMGSDKGAKNQTPVHQVTINYGFAVSQNEISVGDFAIFIQNTGYKTDADKSNKSRIYDMHSGRLKNKYRINWQRNYIGKKANTKDPVIHISWNDANAYSQWLSQQTGKNYRLLSESEFEYILRAGSTSYYPWGEGSPSQVIENLTGKQDKDRYAIRAKWKNGFEKYNDKYWGPAPVASFIANTFHLNDTAGNVMEWVNDCWHDTYTRAPIDGSAWINPGCKDHVIRGGSWSSAKKEFASAHRFKAKSNFTDARIGFRIAVNLK